MAQAGEDTEVISEEKRPLLRSIDRNVALGNVINGPEPSKPDLSMLGTLRSLPRSVYMIYLFSFVNMFVLQAIQPVTVLYLDFRGWTTKDDVRYFSYLAAVAALAPVPFNLILGAWAGRRGTREVMFFGTMFAVLGFAGLIVFDNSIVFAFSYGACYMMESIRRTIHQSYIASVISTQQRMLAMSIVPLAVSLGAFSGPLVSLLCDYGPVPTANDSLVTLDAYTLVFIAAGAVAAIELWIIAYSFHAPRTSSGSKGGSATKMWSGQYVVPQGRAPPLLIDPKAHTRWCVVYFCAKIFLMNVSAGFFMVTMQPLLVHTYGFGQTAMARISMLYCGLAVIPPLIMSVLSMRLSSRTIMIVGGFLKLAGMLVYSFPPAALWSLLLGYILLLKGAIFVITATITLFTQLLGKRCSPGMVGLLACMYALGMGVGSIVGGHALLPFYGEWLFPVFSAGAVVSCLMAIVPSWYRRLDVNSAEVKLLHADCPPDTA